MSSTAKLVFLGAGVQVSFILFGLAQESLTSTGFGEDGESFHYTSFLVLLQSAGNALVALVMLLAMYGSKADVTGGVPVQDWLKVAIGYLGAHKCGLEALRFIIFPLQVVFKSCKPIPVMLGEMLVAREKHSLKKKLSVLLLVAGVAAFTLAKPSKKGESFHLDSKTMWGLTLVSIGLVCDGFYGPFQNKIVKQHSDLSSYHLMFNLNFWQGLFAFASVLPTGELQEVASFVVKHPSIWKQIAVFSATMAMGNVFIFQLQREFGALTVTKVTTARKLLSVLSSVVFFGHKMAALQWVGVLVVCFSNQLSGALVSALKLEGDKKKVDGEPNGKAANGKAKAS